MITCVLGTNKKVLSLQSGYPIINKSGEGLFFEHQIILLLYYQEFSNYYMDAQFFKHFFVLSWRRNFTKYTIYYQILDHWVVEWLMKFYVCICFLFSDKRGIHRTKNARALEDRWLLLLCFAIQLMNYLRIFSHYLVFL